MLQTLHSQKLSTQKLLKQGYRHNKLRKAFSIFYHRYTCNTMIRYLKFLSDLNLSCARDFRSKIFLRSDMVTIKQPELENANVGLALTRIV